MKLNVKSVSAKISLVGALAALVSTVAFTIYGAVYSEYFDLAVLVCLLLGVLGCAAYAFVDGMLSEYLNLIAVVCLSFGVGLFFLNSYPVWADWYGNFTMYGSRGGIVPVIIIMALFLLSIICGIISCFSRKGE